MGKVTANIIISNVFDEARSEDGELPADEIRSIRLDEVLVDTGANMLCLPPEMLRQLGLRRSRNVQIATATGAATTIHRGASLTVKGRSGTFDCLELPGGTMPLLGVLPLEALGIELDLQNQRLYLLPDGGDGTYISILESVQP